MVVSGLVVNGLGRRNADNGDRLVDWAGVDAGEFCDRAGTGSSLHGWGCQVLSAWPVLLAI
jgi:hypothetical protein